jgi:hypothetical protein
MTSMTSSSSPPKAPPIRAALTRPDGTHGTLTATYDPDTATVELRLGIGLVSIPVTSILTAVADYLTTTAEPTHG